MSDKLTTLSIIILATAAMGLIPCVILEVYTHEPIYLIMMKVCCGLFGVGGPLLGWSIARKSKKSKKSGK